MKNGASESKEKINEIQRETQADDAVNLHFTSVNYNSISFLQPNSK